MPFSGISDTLTIHCNENGYFSKYQSDRYGFNNPDEKWDKKEIEYLLIGDSLVHGACVNRPNDMASVLETLSNKSTLNLGYGHRFLSNDKTKFVGFNTFVDRDIHSNSRMSVGAEIRSSAFEANGNVYKALTESDGGGNDVGTTVERVLDGYDMNLVGQIPNMPWANIVYTDYKWICFP